MTDATPLELTPEGRAAIRKAVSETIDDPTVEHGTEKADGARTSGGWGAAAGGVGGLTVGTAAGTIINWLISLLGVEMPGEVEQAVIYLVAVIVGGLLAKKIGGDAAWQGAYSAPRNSVKVRP